MGNKNGTQFPGCRSIKSYDLNLLANVLEEAVEARARNN